MQVNALNHAVDAQQDAISGTHWLLGALVGFITVGPALAFGVFQTADQPYPIDLWYKVWGPFAVVTGIEIWAASWLAPVIGLNMIKERSNGVSLKETMRSNLTTQGLISALFLTIVYAMLQADAPMEDPTTAEPNEFAVLSQWYMMLVTLSLTMVMIGTIATVLLLLYIEPLDDAASLTFITDNMMYFGEPVAMSACAFLNSMIATMLWVFGRYGMGAGIISLLPVWYASCRVVVIFRYLSAWKNKHLPAEERAARAAWGQAVATVGAIAGTKLTGGAEPALASQDSATERA